jgi:hypothetical protein
MHRTLLFLLRFFEVKQDGQNFQERGGERATSVGARLREYLASKVVREQGVSRCGFQRRVRVAGRTELLRTIWQSGQNGLISWLGCRCVAPSRASLQVLAEVSWW